MANGFVFYEGPSEMDGALVVGIATVNSRNRKTGPAVQTWIMRADVHPWEAMQTGEDKSVCGDCPHSYKNAYSCYVCVHHAPNSIWKAYKAGSYPDAKRGQFIDEVVRMGAYGDPAAISHGVWADLTLGARHVLGYTHQWPDPRFVWLRQYAMASVDTPEGHTAAKLMGWRTFRCKLPDEKSIPGEMLCAASEEAGHISNCVQCHACCGARVTRPDVVIDVHGSRKKRYVEWRENGLE